MDWLANTPSHAKREGIFYTDPYRLYWADYFYKTLNNLLEVHSLSNHTGGGQFGKSQNSWPFVTLTIKNDGILMKTILQQVWINRKSIQTIMIKRAFITHRFVFKHNDPTIEKEIEFWTFSPGAVANALRSQGYSVLEGRQGSLI